MFASRTTWFFRRIFPLANGQVRHVLKSACWRGFTLIELLVVISIIAVILGITVGSYKGYRDKQELIQAGKSLISTLRVVQSQAFGGVKDSNCTTESLIGWYVRFSPTTYTVNGRCTTILGTPRTTSLSSNITISMSPAADILFQPVNKDVVFVPDATGPNPVASALPDTQAVITLSNIRTGQTFFILVRQTGDISEVLSVPTPIPTRTPTPVPPTPTGFP